MRKVKYIFTCDICGEQAETGASKDKPPMWVSIDIEPDDAHYADPIKHICDECCLTVKAKHEKG